MARRPRGASTGGGARAASEALEKALAALKDPRVIKLIHEHSTELIDFAKDRAPGARRWISDRSRRFGQSGLEQRAVRVRGVITRLSNKSPEHAEAFSPVFDALDDVDNLLEVAAALPFVKRKKVHSKIDSRLDDLESGLSDLAVLQSPPT